VTSPLKTWRLSRREALFWQRAMARSKTLPRGEVLSYIDQAVMMSGRALSQYRSVTDPELAENELRELRMNLEAALGMLDDLMEREKL
jgi:hypothetical protein